MKANKNSFLEKCTEMKKEFVPIEYKGKLDA
jgi:hypothetical protein